MMNSMGLNSNSLLVSRQACVEQEQARSTARVRLEKLEYRSSNGTNQANEKPRVLLTNSDRFAYPARIAVALSKLGCDVSAVCSRAGHPLTRTRAVQRVFPYRVLKPLDSLRYAIEQAKPEMIVPCDDRAVQHLHELHKTSQSQGASGKNLAELIERSLGAPEYYSIVSSRHLLMEAARELGIRVPATKIVHSQKDLASWQEEQKLPWVLKADGTWGGCGVRMAQTPQQAEQSLLELTRLPGIFGAARRLMLNRDKNWLRPWWSGDKPSVIVQNYVEGRPANSAVFCREGEILAEICVEVVCSQGSKGPAIVVRVVNNHEMTMAAEKIARHLKLSGFFGLDFMIEEESGLPYLIEMNPRCTPLSHLQLGHGRDLMAAFRAQLTGHSSFAETAITSKDMIAYFPQALNCNHEFLDLSYMDVPDSDPDLVEGLLHPLPERRWMGRRVDRVRRFMTEEKEPDTCVFKTAIGVRTSSAYKN
jgi:hypothetical protein